MRLAVIVKPQLGLSDELTTDFVFQFWVLGSGFLQRAHQTN